MKTASQKKRKLLRALALVWWTRIALALFALIALSSFSEALARVGGGQSYGGSGSGSGNGGGAAGIIWLVFRLLFWLTINYPAIGIPVDIIVIVGLIYYFFKRNKTPKTTCSSTATGIAVTTPDWGGAAASMSRRQGFAQEFNQLRRFDPNFSEIIFTDFCYALYAKAQDARGHGKNALDLYSPYLSEEARATLMQRNPAGTQSVIGIIVGSMQVADVRGLATPLVQISVEFEANYTEVTEQQGKKYGMAYYVRESWQLERKRDLLSPTPQQATALHCPRCGAALQQDTTGACAFCGAKIESGEFQWYVRSIALLARESRGPLLTSDVPEVGTDYPTVVQPNFANIRAGFESAHTEFSWGKFEARVRLIFNELQSAWSSLKWERARPFETDNIFQMHRYWIEAYQRQGLRNALDQCQIISMQPVKIKEDAFYNSITMRIFAQGCDYTVDREGKVVSGSNRNVRRWSEYWTFIRSREAKPAAARADLNCPNCGAPLKVNMTGVCEFCGGKVSSGDFDWVLSKIEQDESYAG
ncbi:MAG TPA: TIM44-like domain-containing protein [Pyrinomonadaceae bacterium]|nr:TIM44-like domain-containing protein [Pyrinomonadaceae bacterium]